MRQPGLDTLIRTTTFRLALRQAVVILGFVLVLLAYVYVATVWQLARDAEAAADQEFAQLERAYAEGGRARLEQEVVERAARQGSLLYALAESDGTVVAGDLEALPQRPGDGVERVTFPVEQRQARGRMGRLLNGPILLVASDLGVAAQFSARITRVLWTVGVLGLLFSVIGGLLASRHAAQRVEDFSNTARDVMAGDLSRRAPDNGAGDEFDDLAREFNAMLTRLETLVRTTRTAGDAMAHDLRSPLTRLKQRLDHALEAAPDAERDREALRKASEECDRLLEMFQAVLRLARLESRESWTFAPTDVSKIMHDLVEFYEPAAEDAHLTLRAVVADGLTLNAEAGLIQQAVSNLIENALKYTPSGGRVEIRAGLRPDGRLELAVLDDGPGVPQGERDRVMERFVRLEQSRTSEGSGLGLSLVSAVARLHRGVLALGDGLGQSARPGLRAALVLPSA